MVAIDFFNSIVSGTIQGVSELFPVSSSAHLLIFSHLTGLHLEIAVLHIGTFIAIVIGMWDKIKEIKTYRTISNIIIATIPGLIIGYIFKDWIDENLSQTWIIGISLIFWGIVLILVDQISKSVNFKTKKICEVTPLQSLIVGVSQVIAFIPGTSRAGITVIAGILSGIEPQTALEFAFLSGLILIPGAAVLSIVEGLSASVSTFCVIIATLISATVGFVVITMFRNYINKKILTACGVYRIVLGIIVLLFI